MHRLLIKVLTIFSGCSLLGQILRTLYPVFPLQVIISGVLVFSIIYIRHRDVVLLFCSIVGLIVGAKI